MEIQRISPHRCCQKCYYVFTQLEFLVTSCLRAYGYLGRPFILPECVYRPMSANSICSSVNGSNFHQELSAGIRERPFQFTKIEGSHRRVSLPCLSPGPQLQPRNILFSFPEITFIPGPCCSGGVPGQARHLLLHRRHKLYSGHQATWSAYQAGLEGGTGRNGPPPSPERARRESSESTTVAPVSV